MNIPESYTTPLTARADIANYLMNRKGRYYRDHGHLLFVFNVKVYNPDLDFDHMLDLYVESGYGAGKTDPGWIEEARQRHAETDPDDLYQMGVEDAGRQVTESDCFNHLYDGTPVDVEYAFVGRSSGWMALTKFEEVKLIEPENLRNVFHGDQNDDTTLSDESLHRLYALVRMLEHDLTQQKAQAEVEYQAAFNFFENVCADIPTADVCLGEGI